MSEPAVLWPDAATPPVAEPAPVAVPTEPLEPRVLRLETAVAVLQDTKALEDRVVERVSERLQGKIAVEAERLATVQQRAATTAVMASAAKTLRAVAPLATPVVTRGPLFAVDLVVEFVAIFRMFFDYTYKVGWPTRLVALVLVPAILTSHLWFPLAQFWVIDKLLDLALAFILYKTLSREAQRYLQMRSS